ncbi:hypothetical protein K440DRAFT_631952 [Wilcoxina mikolae CBS 423.85]|nr:hypothetical protein K440DRAFT_631952 [Wilcoxina mikolae CBS 423.85]
MSTIASSLSFPAFMGFAPTKSTTAPTSPILLFLGSIGVFTTYTVWTSFRQLIQNRSEQLERRRSEIEFKERYDTWVRAHRERYGGY